MQSNFYKGVIYVFIGAICFATKGIFAKLAFRYHVDGLQILTLRMLFSLPFYIFILAKEYRQKQTPISNPIWTNIILLGLIGYYLAALFDFLGLQYVSANLERNIIFTYPTFVLIMSKLFYKRKIYTIQTIAVIICYIGILMAFYSDRNSYISSNLTKGTIFVLLSAVTYALYLVKSDNLIKNVGTVRFTCISMIVSCIAVLVHYIVIHGFNIFTFAPQVYWIGLAVAIISTVLPSFLMTYGIALIGSSNMAIIASVGPIATIFMSNYILHEQSSILHIIGTILVLIGVFMVSKYGKKASQ
ncbi:MAG TPA: DMT family transporter [Chitinophagales bacterium]|nr:DMT family transporter [Chitinophagales bacterium]